MINKVSRKKEDIGLQEAHVSQTQPLLDHDGDVYQVIFLPDGRLASCSWDSTVRVWDTASGKVLFTLKGHTSSVYTVALLPNGWLASDQSVGLGRGKRSENSPRTRPVDRLNESA